jgi:hypothetical protein
VCLQLYLASPLTLSEVRAMLPEGVVAGLVSPAIQRQWSERFPSARVVVTLRQGQCACGLAGQRHEDNEEDERRLRARYRKAGLDRQQVITALERHRRAPPRHTSTGAAPLLAGFVAEHARNAGPSLYFLDFSAESERMPPWPDSVPISITATQVRAQPGSWLPEQTPVLVSA